MIVKFLNWSIERHSSYDGSGTYFVLYHGVVPIQVYDVLSEAILGALREQECELP